MSLCRRKDQRHHPFQHQHHPYQEQEHKPVSMFRLQRRSRRDGAIVAGRVHVPHTDDVDGDVDTDDDVGPCEKHRSLCEDTKCSLRRHSSPCEDTQWCFQTRMMVGPKP